MSQDLSTQFTQAEARELTDELKADYGALQLKISTAWRGRIWLALDYESWQDYLDREFKDISLRPPKELEDQVIQELRAAGMSTRGIAAATELSQPTVYRRLQGSGDSYESPDGGERETVEVGPKERSDAHPRALGLDGKSYPTTAPRPTRPAAVDVVDAEIVGEPESEATPAGEDRLAENLGIDPIHVDMSAGRSPIGSEQVHRLINELHAGGSAPLPMVKKKSRSLEAVFSSGYVDDHGLDQERLEDLGRDVADAVGVLTDLLEVMAEADAGAEALENQDTLGSVQKALSNLNSITDLLGLTEGAPAGGGVR